MVYCGGRHTFFDDLMLRSQGLVRGIYDERGVFAVPPFIMKYCIPCVFLQLLEIDYFDHWISNKISPEFIRNINGKKITILGTRPLL